MENATVSERLVSLHRLLREKFDHQPGRIAVALYDKENDWVHAFVESTDDSKPLQHYGTRLSDVPSLKALA